MVLGLLLFFVMPPSPSTHLLLLLHSPHFLPAFSKAHGTDGWRTTKKKRTPSEGGGHSILESEPHKANSHTHMKITPYGHDAICTILPPQNSSAFHYRVTKATLLHDALFLSSVTSCSENVHRLYNQSKNRL